jgi:uncharacterized protein (UPF0332 family)
MSLESLSNKLLKEGKIKKQDSNVDYLNGLLNSAHQNFSSAKYNLKGCFYETAFKSAYDGLLQISRVILFLSGYRSDGLEQHKTTFLLAGEILGEDFNNIIDKIDRYRVKRNRAVYQPMDLLSKSEAEGILKVSEDFWNKAKDYLKKKNKQLDLFDIK